MILDKTTHNTEYGEQRGKGRDYKDKLAGAQTQAAQGNGFRTSGAVRLPTAEGAVVLVSVLPPQFGVV